MRPSASPLVDPSPRDALTAGVPRMSGRIADVSGGILSGSITVFGAALPESLLVAADGRTIGEAAILWDNSAGPDRTAFSRGVWYFDATELPPELLLEERISFAISLPDRPRPLDRIDIEASQFPSLPDLPPAQGRLEGYVDGTEGGTVRGWVWDPTSTGQRIKLLLFVDERFCGIYVADHWRPDLEATGRGDGRYGFSIPAEAFFAQAATPAPSVNVVATEPHFWHVPPAPHLVAPKRRFRLPRPRSLPGTTRELVALLASAEPFPKKIFVIDRLRQTMPGAFSADYALLAIEYLRIEMLAAPAPASATWRELVFAWWRQRIIRGQIRRLSALADAAAASQKLLDAAASSKRSP